VDFPNFGEKRKRRIRERGRPSVPFRPASAGQPK
jgi:hypothetical protein